MHGWRVFVTVVGAFYGALVGVFLVELTQWLDGLLILPLVGAITVAACGWAVFPRFDDAIKKWNAKYLQERAGKSPIPPPPGVVRLGFVLGMAEGIAVGVVNGGFWAAVVGGFLSGELGLFIAVLSWQVRRHVSVLAVAFLLGFFIEMVGCLWIAHLVKAIQADPLFRWMMGALLVIGILKWVYSGSPWKRFTRPREITSTRRAETDILAAHPHGIRNRRELEASEWCGCFYCLALFKPERIERWLNEGEGTALCPECGIDAVIGSASGFPITQDFLEKMYQYWF